MRNGKEEIRLTGRGNGFSLIAFRNTNTASSSRGFSSLLHLSRAYRVYKFTPGDIKRVLLLMKSDVFPKILILYGDARCKEIVRKSSNSYFIIDGLMLVF